MTEISHQSQVKIDQALTNLVMGYGNNIFIADQVIPTLSVAKDSDKFYVWEENGTSIEGLEMRRSDRAKAAEVGIGVTTDNYTMEQYALRDFMPDGLLKNADSMLNFKENSAKNLIDLLDMKREVDCKDLIFTSGNYASTLRTTLATNDRWSVIGHADSNPQADILAAKHAVMKAARVIPNTLVIGVEGFDMLRQHDKVKEAVKYVAATGDMDITKQVVARYLGVEQIIVGTAVRNTAKEGQTISNAFIWGTHAALIYQPKSAVMNQPAFAYEFRPSHTPRTVSTYQEPGLNGEFIEVNEKRAYKQTFQKAGYLFINAFDES